MATYRIVCTIQVPVTAPTSHAHITKIGYTENFAQNNSDDSKTLEETLEAMTNGDLFYTYENGHKALVEKHRCAFCPKMHIRTKPDQFRDNNLDSLRRCNWKN